MRGTHKFHGAEVVNDEECYFVDGEVSFSVEDCSIGYVPYGDTVVWHPGNGDMTIEHEVTIDSVSEADDLPLPLSAGKTCLQGMVDYFETTKGEEELLDACKP